MRPQRRRVETRPPIFFLTVFHKFLPKRRKAGTSEKKSRLPANITLSAPLWGVDSVPAVAEAVRSAPAHCGAAFPRHTRVSRHPPAQTHTRSGSQQAARLKKGAGFPQALNLVRENQQSSAHNFVKDFSLFFPKICRLCPLKKGAATENPLEYGKTEVQILFEPLQAAISSMELPKNFENKKLPNPLR